MISPLVSVIVPCRNERATIGGLLDALAVQTYPLDRFEVLIADAMSADGTRQAIAAWAAAHPNLTLRVLDNPAQIIPAALNLLLAAARGAVIVRMDAHAAPERSYIARCVAALDAGVGDVVGGVWRVLPGGPGPLAAAIAAAAAHPLAVGDARYRYARTAGPVDTVPFGAFSRALVERVGPYDATLEANEDYELNARVRLAGGVVWLDPAIESVYYARSTLGTLARQYARYGWWKFRMLRRHPQTLRWRQAAPPLLVLGLALLAAAAPFLGSARRALLAALGLYGGALLGTSALVAARRGRASFAPLMPLAVATMHLAWGWGFVMSAIASLAERTDYAPVRGHS